MKKLLPILLSAVIVLFISLHLSKTTNASAIQSVHTNVMNSQLLENPSTDSKVITTIKEGEFVTTLSVHGEWTRVKFKEVKGYINTNALSKKKANYSTKIASPKSGLKIYAAPNTNSVVYVTINQNDSVNDFGKVNSTWSFVQRGNTTGYVFTKSLSKNVEQTKNNTRTVYSVITASTLYTTTSEKSKKLASLKAQEFVTSLSTHGEWTRVLYRGKKGYVKTEHLAKRPAYSTLKIVEPKAGLKIYAQPNTNSTVYTTVKKNTTVKHYYDLESYGKWSFVQSGNVTGFALRNSLKSKSNDQVVHCATDLLCPPGFELIKIGETPPGAKRIELPDKYYHEYSFSKKLSGLGNINEIHVSSYHGSYSIKFHGIDKAGKSMLGSYSLKNDMLTFVFSMPELSDEDISLLYELGREFAEAYGMQ